jgi:hypothetical protein
MEQLASIFDIPMLVSKKIAQKTVTPLPAMILFSIVHRFQRQRPIAADLLFKHQTVEPKPS